MDDEKRIEQKFRVLNPLLDERSRRLWAACEAKALGWGGIALVSRATGLSRTTISTGLREYAQQATATEGRVAVRRTRRAGGGRKRLIQHDPGLWGDLELLVDPVTRGDPQSPLRWTCKSTCKLATELQAMGHAVSARTVAHLLHQMHYSLQANRKTREGADHPDRDAQFTHINEQTKAFQAHHQPVVSVDTKKKELIGDFKNRGQEWQPSGEPEAVRVYDFVDNELGKAIPYGVYDVTANSGWVTVGTDHDTAEFAVETLRHWWQQMGVMSYPKATELLIIADGGGSNGSRTRLWKTQLQRLANETRLRISVCHLPPGTSKWNKIEHRMFAYITQNWRGRPLTSHEVIVNLIGNTTTQTGLHIHAELDTNHYATGKRITDKQFAAIRIERDPFHGEWNYTIVPEESGK
jgi:hypothetical protein